MPYWGDRTVVLCIKHIKPEPLSYPTDLTPGQMLVAKSIFGSYIPRMRKYDIAEVLNAIAYVIKSGLQWHMLPRDSLSQSQKGIDGHKRIKGIKRHMAVDRHGYPLALVVTTTNVHDSKAAYPLIASLLHGNPEITGFKSASHYNISCWMDLLHQGRRPNSSANIIS